MIKLTRVCIPIGLNCNLQCKYCYRGLSVGDVPTKISPLMREYLPFIDKEWCQAVCMSGGEPLLYLDTIKEIFSLVKPDVHRKIMTNGILLTQDLVDYINEHKVELWLSHDGAKTKYLRGYDVLEDPNIVKLVKQINILSIASVVTNVNCDVMENYRDTVNKIGRQNFFYAANPIYFNGYNQYLIDGFDYETFARSHYEFQYYVFKHVPYYGTSDHRRIKPRSFNVDLNGNIVDKNTLAVYGTVLDTREQCLERLKEAYKDAYCKKNIDCVFKEDCMFYEEQASEHFCRCAKIMGRYV